MPVVDQSPTQPVSPDPSAVAAPDAPSPPTAPAQRPDGLADRFWDEATGPRYGELIAEFNSLAGEQQKLAEAFKDFPKDAAKAGDFYKLPEAMLPEGVTLPDGTTFKPNDALLAAALPVLHKHRIALDAFHDLVRAFNAQEVARYQAAAADFVKDGEKLGANGPARRQAVAAGLKALAGDKANFIDAGAISSGAVEFFEAIIAKMSAQGGATPQKNGATPPPPAPEKPIEQRWYG